LTTTKLDTEGDGQERLVRVLLGFEPKDLGVMPLTRAIDLATELDLDVREEGLDIVRIYDHGRLVYGQQAERQEARRLIRRATRSTD
jgi:translation initiation factor IF-3